jgi:hypothetical protein
MKKSDAKNVQRESQDKTEAGNEGEKPKRFHQMSTREVWSNSQGSLAAFY